jgi:AraC family transcriptional regulator
MRSPGPPPECLPLDTPLYASSLLHVGAFRAAPSHPRFHDSGPVQGDLFVFPRTSVWLRHEGGRPFVANPNLVTFYNRGQVYYRDKLSEEGDRCEWFAFDRTVLLDALRSFDPAVVEHPDRPFTFSRGPSDPRSYLVQRLVVRDLMAGGPVDGMYVEETMLNVLSRLLDNAVRARGLRGEPGPEAARGDGRIEEVQVLLSLRFRDPLSLEQIAGRVGVSVFYLCRLFRRTTGLTLHAYRNRLRLWTALESVADRHTDLTDLGLDLGYSSHSHFTAAFRQTFGTTPSELRRAASVGCLRELASRLLPVKPKP